MKSSKMSGLMGLGLAAVLAVCLVPSEAQAFTVHVARPHVRPRPVVHVHPRPVVKPAPVVRVAPATVVVASGQTWVPGHYEEVSETKVVAPGHYEKQWVPPQYETVVNADGTTSQVLVRDGHSERVWVPTKTEVVTRQVWIPGHYTS